MELFLIFSKVFYLDFVEFYYWTIINDLLHISLISIFEP